MYDDFAKIYDRFQEIDYSSFIDFYKAVFDKLNRKPRSIIDLGCGTGSVAVLLAREGYSVTGIDISSDMLAIAQNKAIENGADILFLNQSMTELAVPERVDCVISSLDCINYLTSLDEIKCVFSRVYDTLKPNGIFIFDINSEYKLSNILGNNTFVYEDDDAYCVWECGYFPQDGVTSFDLNFFIRDADKKYIRYSEYQEEFLYSIDELKEAAAVCGFGKISVYSDLTFNTPSEKTERIFFVLEK